MPSEPTLRESIERTRDIVRCSAAPEADVAAVLAVCEAARAMEGLERLGFASFVRTLGGWSIGVSLEGDKRAHGTAPTLPAAITAALAALEES